MHDELGQHLTALRLKASVLRMQLDKDNLELLGRSEELISLVDDTMQVVRGVIASLRPAALDTVSSRHWNGSQPASIVVTARCAGCARTTRISL
nr:histidine kinase dimerization/phosphoacceptor domain-containing protein [Paraburkholderia mimosarum]